MSRGRSRNRLIRFEVRADAEQVGGGRDGPWEEHCTAWAGFERVESLRGDIERMVGGAVNSRPLIRIVVDSTTQTRAITAEMQAVDTATNQRMNINYVQDLTGMNREIVITATEGAPS